LGDGTKQAKETLLTGEDQLNAKDALGVVIINRAVPNNTVFETSMSVAKSMATASERSICFTKRVINETYETMGFIRALKSSLNLDVLLNIASDPVKDEFNRIRHDEGVGATIAWRDARFRTLNLTDTML